MTKCRVNIRTHKNRLQTAFIIVLFSLTLCFYIFPKFNYFDHNRNIPDIPTIEIIEIPSTKYKYNKSRKFLTTKHPDRKQQANIPDSLLNEANNLAMKKNFSQEDSISIAFISDLFPELLKINDFDPEQIIEESKMRYNFKNYFKYRMSLKNIENNHEPSSPLVDDALGSSMGQSNKMLQVNLLQIPLSTNKTMNIVKARLFLKDFIEIKKHFNLLQHFYDNPNIGLTELYNIDIVNEKYTYVKLSSAVDSLKKQGLIINSENQINPTYRAAFTISEMIEHLNRILTEIPDSDLDNREYVYGLIHQLINWS